jgi:hypothetical protein
MTGLSMLGGDNAIGLLEFFYNYVVVQAGIEALCRVYSGLNDFRRELIPGYVNIEDTKFFGLV